MQLIVCVIFKTNKFVLIREIRVKLLNKQNAKNKNGTVVLRNVGKGFSRAISGNSSRF